MQERDLIRIKDNLLEALELLEEDEQDQAVELINACLNILDRYGGHSDPNDYTEVMTGLGVFTLPGDDFDD